MHLSFWHILVFLQWPYFLLSAVLAFFHSVVPYWCALYWQVDGIAADCRWLSFNGQTRWTQSAVFKRMMLQPNWSISMQRGWVVRAVQEKIDYHSVFLSTALTSRLLTSAPPCSALAHFLCSYAGFWPQRVLTDNLSTVRTDSDRQEIHYTLTQTQANTSVWDATWRSVNETLEREELSSECATAVKPDCNFFSFCH